MNTIETVTTTELENLERLVTSEYPDFYTTFELSAIRKGIHAELSERRLERSLSFSGKADDELKLEKNLAA